MKRPHLGLLMHPQYPMATPDLPASNQSHAHSQLPVQATLPFLGLTWGTKCRPELIRQVLMLSSVHPWHLI